MNRMKNKPSLWNSVSALVVAVLIVTAFIRGMAQIWLYAAVFALSLIHISFTAWRGFLTEAISSMRKLLRLSLIHI